MGATVIHSGYGRPASNALASAIRAIQDTDRFAPVTVVVPSNFAGLSMRRLLGSAALDGRGIAGVSFVTPIRLAEVLAGPEADRRPPLTNAVLRAAVRATLRDDPGPLGEVAEHHATEQAIADLYVTLAALPDDALATLRAGAGDDGGMVAVHDRVAARAADHADERALVERAIAAVETSSGSVGHVVWHLPQPGRATIDALFRAVVEQLAPTVVVGSTGDPAADQAVHDLCRRAGLDMTGAGSPDDGPPAATRIVSVTDADEEARATIRGIVQAMHEGIRADRIAVFFPSADPYLRTLRHHFAEAGIPANGPSPQRLRESVAGRALIRALELPGTGWRRPDVVTLLAECPRTDEGARLPATRWDELSRAAGITGGRDAWQRRLVDAAERLERRATDGAVGADDERVRRWTEDAADLRRCGQHIITLADCLERIAEAGSWSEAAAGARTVLELLVGDDHGRAEWPEHERSAAERVVAVLDQLSGLDGVDAPPDRATFTRALTAELDVARARDGRFGEGVVYGPVGSSVGLDFDAVFLLGMAEGLAPAPRRDDALLPDRLRALIPDVLPTRRAALDDQHRAVLAALAAAPSAHRTMLFPRGDLRSGGERLPSRWLLDSASALVGETVHSTDFSDIAAAQGWVVASHGAALRSDHTATSTTERDLAAIRDHVDAGGTGTDLPVAAAVGRGLELLAARRSPALTDFDGNLSGEAIPSPAHGTVQSASGLQTWASCGFRYLLGQVLRVAARTDPEDVIELGALDRGSALHRILERFFGAVIETGPPEPGARWSGDDRQRMADIVEEELDHLEHMGVTGRAVSWDLHRRRIHRTVQAILDEDDQHRARRRTRPVAVELAFGFDDHGAEVALPDGRAVRFRGLIDRVDRGDDGTVVVLDYKSGRATRYRKLAEDPVSAGKLLQLGVYAEAARARLGDSGSEVESYYWMLDDTTQGSHLGYPWSPPRRQRFVEVLDTIVRGIDAGAFDAVPGEWNNFRQTHDNCTYCDYDDVCPRDRGEHAAAKSDDVRVQIRAALEPGGDEA